MKVQQRTIWNRWKYRLNGLLLIAPAWFFYAALNPEFPAAWPAQQIGPFSAIPTPANDEPPYRHDGGYQKDFSVRFCEGCVSRIRNAYVSVGPGPVTPPATLDGVLHGDSFNQHVHVPFPAQVGPNDRLWIVVQAWNGEVYQASWQLQD